MLYLYVHVYVPACTVRGTHVYRWCHSSFASAVPYGTWYRYVWYTWYCHTRSTVLVARVPGTMVLSSIEYHTNGTMVPLVRIRVRTYVRTSRVRRVRRVYVYVPWYHWYQLLLRHTRYHGSRFWDYNVCTYTCTDQTCTSRYSSTMVTTWQPSILIN